ncbi:MAG: hypothetical protein V4691_08720 [Pseudomonadota bacterium]
MSSIQILSNDAANYSANNAATVWEQSKKLAAGNLVLGNKKDVYDAMCGWGKAPPDLDSVEAYLRRSNDGNDTIRFQFITTPNKDLVRLEDESKLKLEKIVEDIANDLTSNKSLVMASKVNCTGPTALALGGSICGYEISMSDIAQYLIGKGKKVLTRARANQFIK